MSIVYRAQLRRNTGVSASAQRVLAVLVEHGPTRVDASVALRAAAGSDVRAYGACAALLRAGLADFVGEDRAELVATAKGRRYSGRDDRPAAGRRPKRKQNRG